ncbi:Putative teichuronic acid biosynthesis glycosyltransferase TuaH [Aquisphaera giovannonii]|uniref:Teichuronic acid biosynthesis glycosyltransferase TuaH n=1 Tax=Aquisphaera giovannonii TaxID=406548 RepID=A0A5B9WBJ0_9BACT|nr:glycosyltransferase [Aquisphaera giovannonii]QEH37843.1 Putative teichuronic acid biosynthesis glycosyltransferase TuaH [Aquisphaera giovannonii]
MNTLESPPSIASERRAEAVDEAEQVFLYFGNDWFAENRTSSHHIAEWLARRHRVYYIECPGLRAPKGTGRDLKKIWAKLWRFALGARTVSANLKVRTLFQVPLHRFAIIRHFNRFFVTATLRWLTWREGIRRPIAWFMIPHLAGVLGRLQEEMSVYYCIDDYAALPDVDAAAVQAMDEEMTRRADLVFVASDTLLEPKRRLNAETRLSPHGVDVAHFARALDDATAAPAELAGYRRPLIGFFGLIERWIDLDLIDYLAGLRPDWSFLLIGRLAVPADRVQRRPNVHFLGKRPYADLPSYGRQFDAAIIPYRLTRQVLHANPIKLREYLAMGKPIVSVRTPEIEKYADVVEIADTAEEFLAKLDVVLGRPESEADVRCRTARVAAESWDARLNMVLEVVRSHLPSSHASIEPSTELRTP